MRGLKNDAVPLRITGLSGFLHKHDEVPERLVKGNDQVRTWGNCSACHQGARKGKFDENSVRIPGVSFWDFYLVSHGTF
jgi:hypothetical protein